ncbi:MAG: esterase-like activity of phytase family protein [Caldilineaceae bacterium]
MPPALPCRNRKWAASPASSGDAANDRYFHAISDDRGQRNPARFYTLAIDLADGTLDEGDAATFEAVTTLLDETGAPFAGKQPRPRWALPWPVTGRLFISSEGNVTSGAAGQPLYPRIFPGRAAACRADPAGQLSAQCRPHCGHSQQPGV